MKKFVLVITMISIFAIGLIGCTQDNISKQENSKKSDTKDKSVSVNLKLPEISDKDIKDSSEDISGLVKEYKNLKHDLEEDKESIDNVILKDRNTVEGHVDQISGSLKEILGK
ncbi:hypothetical protein [Clostridium baratii]|uniref:hypothetical protein n=1 Tax=Clostridium baratii TaxID=1561 RepID=UPI0005F2A651|nr:hypothetical protein [Clostridium baratii]AQM60645.1 hypothetical protein NPD11_938 [Clostridium baratii]KJU72786.1 hypothetical protein UC77_02060 [Clostridium baratii]MBS6043831.1 hypothetical protein [Clostridium baratii]MBT9831408.1 hypothetical protein [Clostridium baratii]MDY3207847.1 hypothetical protein [Clostridium baratii]